MPFRAYQKMKSCPVGGFECREVVDEINDEGMSLVSIFDPHHGFLPPPEQFDLETLVKAKVPLQQTRTKVIGGDVFGLSDAFNDYTEDEPNKDGDK